MANTADATQCYATPAALQRELLQADLFGVACCVERGVDLNALLPGGGGPPLLEAASQGRLELVRLLLEKRSDPSGRSASGATALMVACGGGHDDVVQELLARGLSREDIVAQDRRGSSALSVLHRERGRATARHEAAQSEVRRRAAQRPLRPAFVSEAVSACKAAEGGVSRYDRTVAHLRGAIRAAAAAPGPEAAAAAGPGAAPEKPAPARADHRWWLDLV